MINSINICAYTSFTKLETLLEKNIIRSAKFLIVVYLVDLKKIEIIVNYLIIIIHIYTT